MYPFFIPFNPFTLYLCQRFHIQKISLCSQDFKFAGTVPLWIIILYYKIETNSILNYLVWCQVLKQPSIFFKYTSLMSLQLMDSLLFSVTSTFPVTLFSSFLSYSFLCFTFFFTEEKVKRKIAIKFFLKKRGLPDWQNPTKHKSQQNSKFRPKL